MQPDPGSAGWSYDMACGACSLRWSSNKPRRSMVCHRDPCECYAVSREWVISDPKGALQQAKEDLKALKAEYWANQPKPPKPRRRQRAK